MLTIHHVSLPALSLFQYHLTMNGGNSFRSVLQADVVRLQRIHDARTRQLQARDLQLQAINSLQATLLNGLEHSQQCQAAMNLFLSKARQVRSQLHEQVVHDLKQ